MPPGVRIRRAVKEDCAPILELIRELAAYQKAPGEVTVDFDHFVQSGFGANPQYWCFVAEKDGVLIGFALYYIRYSTWKGQRLYLEDFFVTEEWRGRKIGKMLFERLITEAKSKNIGGMSWQVLEINKAAIQFYESYRDVHIDRGWLNCSLNL